MSIDDRFGEEWQAQVCADCDPTLPGMEDSEYEKPYVILLPMDEPAPDHCPRCGSYLGFCGGGDELRITNTPAERWAAKQEAD